MLEDRLKEFNTECEGLATTMENSGLTYNAARDQHYRLLTQYEDVTKGNMAYVRNRVLQYQFKIIQEKDKNNR